MECKILDVLKCNSVTSWQNYKLFVFFYCEMAVLVLSHDIQNSQISSNSLKLGEKTNLVLRCNLSTLQFKHSISTISSSGYKFSKHFIKYKGHNSILEKLLERIYFIEFRVRYYSYTLEIEIFYYLKRRTKCRVSAHFSHLTAVL